MSIPNGAFDISDVFNSRLTRSASPGVIQDFTRIIGQTRKLTTLINLLFTGLRWEKDKNKGGTKC